MISVQIFNNPSLHSVRGLSNLSNYNEQLLIKGNPRLHGVHGLGKALHQSKSHLADIEIFKVHLGTLEKVSCLDLDCLAMHQAIDAYHSSEATVL